MSVRNVKIYTTAGVGGTIETNARTLGELLPTLHQREINTSGMKLLVGETKNELSMDDSVLPEGDFKLYLVPAKTKSGVDFEEMEENIEDIKEDLSDLKSQVRELTALVKALSSGGSVSTSSSPSRSSQEDKDMDDFRKTASRWG